MLSSILPLLTDAHISSFLGARDMCGKRDLGYWAREDSNTQEALPLRM